MHLLAAFRNTATDLDVSRITQMKPLGDKPPPPEGKEEEEDGDTPGDLLQEILEVCI